MFRTILTKNNSSWWLKLEGFEGRGIGSRLMERVIEESKVRGCYKIILSSDEKNAGFYKRFGFQEKEIAMRLDLH